MYSKRPSRVLEAMIVPFRNRKPKVDSKRRNTRNARSKRDGSGLERSPWDEKEHKVRAETVLGRETSGFLAPYNAGPGRGTAGLFHLAHFGGYCSRRGR